MIKITRYISEHKEQWNAFISNAHNGLFMFNRDYMDYHSNRFFDHSLCFYKDNQLIALMPANIVDSTLFSHQGLTFGSIVIDDNVSTLTNIEIFECLIDYLKDQAISSLIYKTIPHLYHETPIEIDKYLLFKYGATVHKVELTTTISLSNPKKISQRRKRCITKANKNNLLFKQSNDWRCFWKVLKYRLEKSHNTSPTHSLREIVQLNSKFPENIKLFAGYNTDKLICGAVIYEYENIVHTQYISSSDLGYELHALDGLFDYLIKLYSARKKYFDFGISTENHGKHLNTGLLKFKEEFGGSNYNHITWKLEIN